MTGEFIKNTFIKLTSRTCPHGYEDQFVEDVMHDIFPKDIQRDAHGNYFYKIGTNSRTVFTSHIDTVSKEYVEVNHQYGDFISTDGKTTLGADDKAGMTLMLWMIKNKIPGVYYFFIGEEVGCIGSGLAAKYGEFKGRYDRMISFDRRDVDSVITYQSSTRCCSDKFAKELANRLNRTAGLFYKPDSTGVYTDSAEFVDLIPECTNISVGYYNEHTFSEYQDIDHLTLLAESCLQINWETLPTFRNPLIQQREDVRIFNWPKEKQKIKRSRRSRKHKKQSDLGHVYYDQVGELIDFGDRFKPKNIGHNNKYTWILDKLTSKMFTWYELGIIRDYYLDMNTDYDNYFYEYLKEQVIDF